MFRECRWAASFALLAWAAQSFVAAAGEGETGPTDPFEAVIPFRLGNLTPPSAIVLAFAPTPAASVGKHRTVFAAGYAHASNFIVSDNIEAYFENCDPPTSLKHEDPAALLGLEGETYLVDGEVGVLTLTGHYGVTARTHFSVTVPYVNYTGGALDDLSKGFHDTFGIGQNGRDLIQEDEFELVLDLGEGDGSQLIITDPPAGGFGDPRLSLHYGLPSLGRGWKLGFDVGVKIPLADVENLRSTGSSDYGVQAALQKSWRRQSVVVNASFVKIGGFDQLPGFEPADVTALNASWTHPLSARLRGALQARAATSIFRDSIPSELGETEIMLGYGAWWQFGNQSIGLAITENFLNHDSTSDVAFQLAYGLSLR